MTPCPSPSLVSLLTGFLAELSTLIFCCSVTPIHSAAHPALDFTFLSLQSNCSPWDLNDLWVVKFDRCFSAFLSPEPHEQTVLLSGASSLPWLLRRCVLLAVLLLRPIFPALWPMLPPLHAHCQGPDLDVLSSSLLHCVQATWSTPFVYISICVSITPKLTILSPQPFFWVAHPHRIHLV